MQLHIRPADCDSFGHVNNAVYASFLEQVLASSVAALGYGQDWTREGAYLWRPRELSIEFRQPALLGDELDAQLWLLQADRVSPVLGFEIKRSSLDGGRERAESIVRARAVWQRLERGSGEPVALDASTLVALAGSPGTNIRAFSRPADCPACRHYIWDHVVRRTELNAWAQAQLTAVYHWLEVALFDASTQGGWPISRWLQAGYFTLQTRHDTQFFCFPRLDESIRVTSRIVEIKRLRGTWLIEGRRHRDGALLFSDYSTGVFLNLEGRPATPPAHILDEIRFGV